ncbi:hypothetical protein N3K66_001164 [Trichothecium roseum]|uniref:Uncharacterized protein n=1 Tax=Trichothecium roseum TaxID=47278 RepID=A0ACC0VFL5_9HYPO|nr:hypothetical protein N3K66_001164 [Trichothecium roseum]
MRPLVLGALALLSTGAAAAAHDPVDLGYALHEPSLNETTGQYTFKNIRYADPPTDALRFRAPVPVSTKNRTAVQDGSVGSKCPQAFPAWALTEEATKAGMTPDQLHQVILADPEASEDCLFLNVVVPKAILDAVSSTSDDDDHGNAREDLAPVLVWLHGGGYVFGHKDDELYDPSGLVSRSKAEGSKGVIYVAVNYRLGLFGWLNGVGDDVILPNAGLHDQRLAFNWIQDYIHLFGGDKTKVTVMGQSAGGGSIMHHITAEGGNATAPFDRAIIQSPGWEHVDKQKLWNRTLAAASAAAKAPVTSGADLQALGSATLIGLNGALVFASANDSFTFSPTVDQGYVPDNPSNLLREKGSFDADVGLVLGHNANEAAAFVSPDLDSEGELRLGLGRTLDQLTPDAVDYVFGELYPSPGRTDLYDSEYQRACLIVAESSFVCHTAGLAAAFGNATHNYRFDVPPGAHVQDVPWTFYTGPDADDDNNDSHVNDDDNDGNDYGNGDDAVTAPALARAMQKCFTAFARKGDPNVEGDVPYWPAYGADANIVTFDVPGVGDAVDDARSERCEFWLSGEFRKETN